MFQLQCYTWIFLATVCSVKKNYVCSSNVYMCSIPWPLTISLKKLQSCSSVSVFGPKALYWQEKACYERTYILYSSAYAYRLYVIKTSVSTLNSFVPADQNKYLCKQYRSRWDVHLVVFYIHFWLTQLFAKWTCPKSTVEECFSDLESQG